MTQEKISDGLYFLHPEGSCWIGATFRGGKMVSRIEASNAATHSAASDQYAGCVPSENDVDVDPYEADTIVAAVLDEGTDPSMVIVQRGSIRNLVDSEGA